MISFKLPKVLPNVSNPYFFYLFEILITNKHCIISILTGSFDRIELLVSKKLWLGMCYKYTSSGKTRTAIHTQMYAIFWHIVSQLYISKSVPYFAQHYGTLWQKYTLVKLCHVLCYVLCHVLCHIMAHCGTNIH